MNRPLLRRAAPVSALCPLFERELAAAHAAIARNDGEALHDLRVALRRLAVLLEQLAAASHQRKTLLHLIKALLKRTTHGRDAQVMLHWLQGQWPRLSEAQQIGARHWQRQLTRRLGEVPLKPKQIATKLHRLLPGLARLSPPAGKAPLEVLVAQQLQQHTDELLALMQGEGAAGQLHPIRLKAKTVRYLLLPFVEESEACAQAEAALRRMQTLLGEWHDALLRQHSLNALLRNEVVKLLRDTDARGTAGSVAERSPVLPGLLALARSNNLAQQRLIARIEQKYLRDGGASLAGLLQRAIAQLCAAATADV